jgi:hypothetical protein
VDLKALLIRAIEGKITELETIKINQLLFKCTHNEIRVEAGKGERKQVAIWQRVELKQVIT